MPNCRLSQRDFRVISVAVDSGGSRFRSAAVDDRGRVLWDVERPAVPLTRLPRTLATLLKRRSGERPHRLLVGSRGIWTMAERRRLTRNLRGLAGTITVVSDVELVWWAVFGNRRGRNSATGIAVAAGTGSLAIARSARGVWSRAGGLGPKTGDGGSGFWMGREFQRRKFGWSAARLRASASTPGRVAKTAALARRVFAQRDADPVCGNIVREAQGLLADLVLRVAGRPRRALPSPWTAGGSLLVNPAFRRGVLSALRRSRGGRFRYVPPPSSVVQTAARRAALISQGAPAEAAPRRRCARK